MNIADNECTQCGNFLVPFTSKYFIDHKLWEKAPDAPGFCSDKCFETSLRKFLTKDVDFHLCYCIPDEAYCKELYIALCEKHLQDVRKRFPTFAEEEDEADKRTIAQLKELSEAHQEIFHD